MYFSIQIFACFLVTEPQPNPELLPTSRQAESEEQEDKVSVTENREQKLNQSTLLLLIYLTPGRQDPDGRGDWGELCHPQGGAQKEGAVHALAHQVHHAMLVSRVSSSSLLRFSVVLITQSVSGFYKAFGQVTAVL